MERITKAALGLWLAVLAGLAFGGVAADGAAGGVLVIGDSLGVGMEPYLDAELGGGVIATDAEIGRTSAQGLPVLSEAAGSLDYGTLVFALGTNDNPAARSSLAANLAAAHSIAGGRCMVIATVSRPPLNGVSDDGLNNAIGQFARSNSGVAVVEWEDAVRADPGLLRDGVHATAEGYALRAALFADAISGCEGAGAGLSPTGAGGFGGDGIPNPIMKNLKKHKALAEGRTRPKPAPREPEQKKISEDAALDMLADAVSSQIAIGAL